MKTPRKIELAPPDPERLVGWEAMGVRERAAVFLMAVRHRFPLSKGHVGYDPISDVVVVVDPEIATLFGAVSGSAETHLEEIERRGLGPRWEEENRG